MPHSLENVLGFSFFSLLLNHSRIALELNITEEAVEVKKGGGSKIMNSLKIGRYNKGPLFSCNLFQSIF